MPERIKQPDFVEFDIVKDLQALRDDGDQSSELGTGDRAAQALAIVKRAAANAESNHARFIAFSKEAYDEARAAHDRLMSQRMTLQQRPPPALDLDSVLPTSMSKSPMIDVDVGNDVPPEALPREEPRPNQRDQRILDRIGSLRIKIDAAQERVNAALRAMGDAQMPWRTNWQDEARKLGVLEVDVQAIMAVRKQQIDELSGPVKADRDELAQMRKRAEVVDQYKYDNISKFTVNVDHKVVSVAADIQRMHEETLEQIRVAANEVEKILANPQANSWRAPREELRVRGMMDRLKTLHVFYAEIRSDLPAEQRERLEDKIASLISKVGQAHRNVAACVAAVELGHPVDSTKANLALFPLTPLRRAPTSEDVGTPSKITLSPGFWRRLGAITGAKPPTEGSA